ncbi:MAG: WYL domain-containing protein [Bacteroidetes bacterium]|nr:WYL domain-containing protein [Bacteroidota bacterium]
MSSLLDIVLDNTSRQRYAILKFFLDNPNRKFTRQEILQKVTKGEYLLILNKKNDETDEHPFINKSNDKGVPTIFRDRLNELVQEDILQQSRLGREFLYKLNKNIVISEIEKYNISEKHAPDIQSWIPSLKNYGELPFASLLESLDKSSRKIYDDSFKDESHITIVDFETPFLKDYKLSENITELYWIIQDRVIIRKLIYIGNYYPNKEAEKKTLKDFMPYVLKESKGQWYVTGKCEGDTFFRSIPVNRIIEKHIYEDEREFERESFSPAEYWDGCAGITKYGKPIHISFEVKNGLIYNNIEYINSMPLVKGHQKTKQVGDWLKVFLTNVYLGPELIRKIRTFGRNNIKNIKPRWLEEDLWEEGNRKDIDIRIETRTENLKAWEKCAKNKLQIHKGGENQQAKIIIKTDPKNPAWHQVRISELLIDARFYSFITNQEMDLGSERIIVKNSSILK